jgi:NADPH-dependent 2,4-dienoyl-CoA reductase/sulfur reductase-like enzyme
VQGETAENKAETVAQSPRNLPVTCHADVLVAGGGLPGVAAAIRAAGEGLSVMLVEERNCLGHELTTSWHAVSADASIPDACPAAAKLLYELKRQKGIDRGKLDPERARNPLHFEVAAARPRIRVFFFSMPAGVVMENRRIGGIVVSNRAGRQVFLGKVVIDATEDARIATAAGAQVSPSASGALQARRLIAVAPMPPQGQRLTIPSGAGLDDCEVLAGRQYLTLVCQVPRTGDPARNWSQAQAVTLRRAVALGELLAKRDVGLKSFMVSPEIVPLARPAVSCQADGHRPLGVEGLVMARRQSADAEDSPSIETLLCWGDVAGRLAGEQARQQRALLEPTGTTVAASHERVEVKELLAGPDAAIRYPRLRQEATRLPAAAKVDVLVVGGGTSGALAAIAAARQQAQVALVDVLPNLGGTSSNRVNSYYWGVPWKSALSDEIDRPIRTFPAPGKTGLQKVRFSGEEKKISLQNLAEKARVRVFFRCFAAGAVVEGNRLTGAVIESAGGRQVILARVVIDATGHGDVAAAAGAAFDVGRPRDGFLHEAEHGPLRDALDPEDISKYYLRNPSYALSLNIRESRRIRGDATVTFDDVLQGRRFPDVVARWRSNYDSHFPHSANEEDRAQDWMAILGLFRKPLWGDIPYRAILPAGLENILVVGKAYSATHDALIGARMQRDLQHLGEAAGVAAAMACRAGIAPRKLPVGELQDELVRLGVLLPEELVDAYRLPGGAPAIDLGATAARLGGPRALDAMVDLYLAGPAAVDSLLPRLKSDLVAQRTDAALVLGMLGRREAVPVLLDRLARKDPRTFAFSLPNGSSEPSVPVYWSAVILLGRMRVPEASGPIVDLLRDQERCAPALASFAIVALGRIGDRSAVAAIRPYLKVSKEVPLREENTRFEMHWGVRTNAARVLAELGDDSGLPVLVDLLEADQSRLRHYAQRLLEQATGQSLGKDRAAWQRWLAQHKTRPQ